MTDKQMILRKLNEKRLILENKIRNEKNEFTKVGLWNDLNEIDAKIFDIKDGV